MKSKKAWLRYVFIGILLLLLVLSILSLSPFFTAIVFGVLLAYVFYPVHAWVTKRVKRPTLSALIISIVVILLITAPILFTGKIIADDLNSIYSGVRDRIETGDLIDIDCSEQNEDTLICQRIGAINEFFGENTFRSYLSQGVNLFVNFIGRTLSSVLLGIPGFILNIVVLLFVFFYFLRDGMAWLQTIKKVIPLSKKHKEEVFKRTDETLYALLYGQIITSLAQGFLGGLGFYLFGIDHPIFWGMIMAFVSIFPFLGSWLVWAPAALSLFLEATLSSETGLLLRAIGFTAYSLFLVSLSDNFLRPYIVAGKADIHPLIVILGVFGGIAFFGLSGFVLGPLVLALFVVFLQIYIREL